MKKLVIDVGEQAQVETPWGAYVLVGHPNGHALEVHPPAKWRRVKCEQRSEAVVLWNEDRKPL